MALASDVTTHEPRLRFFDSVICECDCITAPAEEGKEGRRQAHKKHKAISADLLMGNYCEQVVHSHYRSSWDSSPLLAGQRSRAHRPAGTVGPVTRSRDIHMKVG